MENNDNDLNNEDNYSDIVVLNFNNEREFNKEVEDILGLTKDIKVDWKKREGAIKKLSGIILSNWGNTSNFIKLFNQKIYLNLSIQLVDLRSSLMKEACRVVILAAKTFKEQIEFAAEKLTSPLVLYKLVGTANRVISDSGSNCIMEIIKNVESVKIISRIHEQMKNKSNVVRLRASQQFLYAISNYSKNTLSKCVSIIEEFIHNMTHDANGEVRACGRKIFLKYLEMSSNTAIKLLNSFDNNVQKSINDEINNNDETEENVMFNQVPKSKTMSNGNCHSISASTNLSSTLSTSSKLRNTMGSPVNINKPLNYTVAIVKKPPELSPKKTNQSRIKQISKTETKNVVKQMNKMTLGGYEGNNYAFTDQKKIKSEFESDDFIDDSPNNPNEIPNIIPFSSSVIEKPKFKNIEELINMKIKSILNENEFSSKLSSFESISNSFNEIYSNFDFISKNALRNLINIHIENLSETYPKLTVQVMKNLTKFIFYLDAIFTEDNILKITKIIIINISSINEQISQNAVSLFELMRKKIDANLLVKPIVEMIDVNTEILILEVSVEVINPIIELAVGTMSDQNYLNSFILKISKILHAIDNDKLGDNGVFQKKILEVLEAIFKNYPKQFYSFFTDYETDREYKNFMIKVLEVKKKKIYEGILKNSNSNINMSINVSSSVNGNNSNNNVNKFNNMSNNTNKMKNYNTPSANNNTFNNNLVTDEEFDISQVKYEILTLATSVKDSSSFLFYLKTNLKANLENFLLALLKIRYEQVLPIIIHLRNLLVSDDIQIPIDFMHLLLNRLVFLLERFGSEYQEQIVELINLLPNGLSQEMYLQIIPKYLTSRQSPHIVQILLLSMKDVISTIDQANLLKLLPSFIDAIFNTLNHHIAEVRKFSVFCIVDLYFALGHNFEPYLNELSVSQRNLINIFIKKKQENK